MFTQLFIALTLILDIVYCAVYTPSRNGAAIAFVAIEMFTKLGMGVFGHWLLYEMGGSYSVSTQTVGGGGGSGSVADVTFSHVSSAPLDPNPPASATAPVGYQSPQSYSSPAHDSASIPVYSPKGEFWVSSGRPRISHGIVLCRSLQALHQLVLQPFRIKMHEARPYFARGPVFEEFCLRSAVVRVIGELR
jgi:hypothetical protein